MKQAVNSLDAEIAQYSTTAVVGVIVSARFFIAFVALLPFSSTARAALSSKEDWQGGLILGGLMLAGFVLQMIGIRSVSPSVSAFLTSLYVVFTAILSIKISDRKPTRMMIVGVALATFGAGFIDGPPHIVWGKGELLTVACALFFALHIIYTDRITKQLDPIAVTSTSFLVLVLGAGIIAVIAGGGNSGIRICVARRRGFAAFVLGTIWVTSLYFDAKHLPETSQSYSCSNHLFLRTGLGYALRLATRHGRHIHLACNGLVTIGWKHNCRIGRV